MPRVLLEFPFVSVGMMLLVSICDVSREVIMLDKILYRTGRPGRHMIGRYLEGLFVRLFFGINVVFPLVSHSGH